ncbi:MAG: hypothetical protein ABJQ14_09545, partial [Hyphomicrobiales bacterium]
ESIKSDQRPDGQKEPEKAETNRSQTTPNAPQTAAMNKPISLRGLWKKRRIKCSPANEKDKT